MDIHKPTRGPGYDGGHPGPSALGFIGEKAGLFPHYEWQNRGTGTPNDEQNFHEVEMHVINEVKRKLTAREPVDLTWEMTLTPGDSPGVPSATHVEYAFEGNEPVFAVFNNMQSGE